MGLLDSVGKGEHVGMQRHQVPDGRAKGAVHGPGPEATNTGGRVSTAGSAPVNFQTDNRGNIRDFNHMGVDAYQSRDKSNALVGNKTDFDNHLPSAEEMANPSTPEMKARMDAEFAKTNAFTENQNRLNSGGSVADVKPANYSAPTPMVAGLDQEKQIDSGTGLPKKKENYAPGTGY